MNKTDIAKAKYEGAKALAHALYGAELEGQADSYEARSTAYRNLTRLIEIAYKAYEAEVAA
jgi:hypothetical protein